MLKKKIGSIALFLLSFALAAVCLGLSTGTKAYGQEIVRKGSVGGLVWDVQHRLQQLGLYPLKLDGHFGPVTRQAVIKFQKQQGLVPDGVVGKKTLTALRKKTFTVEEIEMMARLVNGEARGESLEGQVAVAAVVLNRLKSDKFPNTVRGVIFQPSAFTAVSDGQYYLTPNKTAYRAVYLAIRGWDPSGGALYYFNPQTATSKWIWSRPQITKIGKHIFAK